MKQVALLIGLGLMLAGCGAEQTIVASPPKDAEWLIPELRLPAGAQQVGGGGGGSPNSEGLGLDFYSELVLAGLYADFGDQLAAAGWQVVDEQAAEGQLTSYWELTDAEGTSWASKLTVGERAELGDGGYFMEIKLLLPQ